MSASNNNNNNNDSNININENKAVVIVGGGPAGAAAAKAMADRGYSHIDLYEAYPHPISLPKTSSKAYVIYLSVRGQQGILDSTGIDLTKEASASASAAKDVGVGVGVVSMGVARHVYNPRTKQTSAKVMNHSGLPSLIIPRKVLTGRLLDAAHESGVRVHYQHRLVEVDFENRVATFVVGDGDGDGDGDGSTTSKSSSKTSGTINVEYDLLIGADGGNSMVRNLMVKNNNSLSDFTDRTEVDSMEYQVVTLPESPFNSDNFPEGTVHSWSNKKLNAICLGFPVKRNNNDNDEKDKSNARRGHSMLFGIIFPEGKLESFRSESSYRAPLTALFPDLFVGNDGEQRLSAFEEQLRENPIVNGGLCVWPSSLGHAHGDGGVILLGDSGHGMWPSLGQGANCALESAAVFARCLDGLASAPSDDCGFSSSASWATELIQRFQDARFEDAVAAVDLTYAGVGAKKSRGRLNAPLSHKLQMIGMMLLHKITFGIVPMPAFMQVIKGSNISYSTAKRYDFYYEKYICLGALVGTIAATLVIARTWLQFRGSSSDGGGNNEL